MKLRWIFVYSLVMSSVVANVSFEGISQVDVKGAVQLYLQKQDRSMSSEQLGVVIDRVGSKLMIKTDFSSNKPVKVAIFAKDAFANLQHLNVHGSSSVYSSNIKPGSLHVYSDSSGSIQLTQVSNVARIESEGSGSIEAYWITSPHLELVISNGKVKVGGQVQRLFLTGSGKSKVDASGVVAESAWISAKDESFLKVRATNFISMEGSQDALVESYRDAKFVNEVTRDGSALIHVRG
jgi:hypothetical protein